MIILELTSPQSSPSPMIKLRVNLASTRVEYKFLSMVGFCDSCNHYTELKELTPHQLDFCPPCFESFYEIDSQP